MRTLASGTFVCLCLALSACSSTPPAWAEAEGPVTLQHIVRRSPKLSIFVATLNLADPRVAVHVAPGGPAPTNGSPWVTTLLPPSEIANREHFDIAVNGDFFSALATRDVEGRKTGYVRGKPAFPIGLAMSAGHLWHATALPRPYLEITVDHQAKFAVGTPDGDLDPAAREIVGGGQIIVQAGKPVVITGKFSTARHPRTAVGLDPTGQRLTLLVVDGRQRRLSIGMTLAELAQEMIAQGCDRALNLDGGGSTEMVYRDPHTHKLRVLNSPSDTKERAVADVLGVTIAKPE